MHVVRNEDAGRKGQKLRPFPGLPRRRGIGQHGKRRKARGVHGTLMAEPGPEIVPEIGVGIRAQGGQ